MGNTKNLVFFREARKFRSDSTTDLAADVGINFIEDEEWRGVSLSKHSFEREHYAGGLATRGDFIKRLEVLPGIGGEEKLAMAVAVLV